MPTLLSIFHVRHVKGVQYFIAYSIMHCFQYTFAHIMLILFFTLHHAFTYRMLCDELAQTQDNAAEVIYRKTSYKQQVKLTTA
jgi:hypothetical protein